MQIHEKRSGTVHIIAIEERIDAQTTPVIESKTKKMLNRGQVRLAFDLKNVDYISSSGIKMIVNILKECRSLNGDCRLANLQSNVFKIFEMGGFDKAIKIFATLDEAIQSFEE